MGQGSLQRCYHWTRKALEDKTQLPCARSWTLVASPCLLVVEPSAFSGVSQSNSKSASSLLYGNLLEAMASMHSGMPNFYTSTSGPGQSVQVLPLNAAALEDKTQFAASRLRHWLHRHVWSWSPVPARAWHKQVQHLLLCCYVAMRWRGTDLCISRCHSLTGTGQKHLERKQFNLGNRIHTRAPASTLPEVTWTCTRWCV